MKCVKVTVSIGQVDNNFAQFACPFKKMCRLAAAVTVAGLKSEHFNGVAGKRSAIDTFMR